MITGREARQIAAKLEADLRQGSAHTVATVAVDGTIVKRFGIRRGSRSLNTHIVKDLGISLSNAQALARCDLSKDWYFNKVRQEAADATT